MLRGGNTGGEVAQEDGGDGGAVGEDVFVVY